MAHEMAEAGARNRRRMSVRTVVAIVVAVAVHKLLLLLLLFSSSAIWDTSTQLLYGTPTSWTDKLAARLMVWDNVHFNALTMNHGPRFEHEHAFSNVWATVVRSAAPYSTMACYTLTAAFLSLVAHTVSAILVEYMAGDSLSGSGFLYILHPAGVFLVSGYTESAFAMFVLLGLLLVRSRAFVVAGAMFALATLLRSNGLIWGLVFAQQLCMELYAQRTLGAVRVIVGGSLMLGAFVATQYAAYAAHCPGLAWCSNTVPSIYLYVQAHYWNNGFLKYWTVANLPNFLLALPTLVLLCRSMLFLARRREYGIMCVQAFMVVGAVLFWHVQIITRLASCTPGPIWYVSHLLRTDRHEAKAWIAYFALWTSAQAALYGAFLPPA